MSITKTNHQHEIRNWRIPAQHCTQLVFFTIYNTYINWRGIYYSPVGLPPVILIAVGWDPALCLDSWTDEHWDYDN